MPDARVVRPIPGADLRPDDWIYLDDDGATVMLRVLTETDLAVVRAHRSHLAVFRPMSAWLTPAPSRPDRARILRLVPAGERVEGGA